MRSMAGSDGEPVSARLKAVRDATGLTQLQFLPRLNSASAQVLGAGVRDYTQSTLSKLETGTQEANFDDIAVFATADPLRRGKLWLAWRETEDATMKAPRRMGPSVIKEPPEDTFDQPIPRTKRPAKRTG